MDNIMKIVKFFEQSRLLTESVSITTENKVKEQKGGFLSMLLSTLGDSLLEDLLIGSGVIRVKGAGNRRIRAGHFTNFKAQKYYQDELAFNVYSKNNFPKIKDGPYLINLDEYKNWELIR